MAKQQIMDSEQLRSCISGLSDKIRDSVGDVSSLNIIGIRRGGAAIAKYIADDLQLTGTPSFQLGELDVTLYRDDLEDLDTLPMFFATNIPFDVNGRTILLIDDVIGTGRTCRAALDAIFLLGRPRRILYATVIDRGHRELPVQPDFIGTVINTAPQEYIKVKTPRFDGELSVTLCSNKSEAQISM